MSDDYINDIPTDIPNIPRQEPRTFPYPIGLPPNWSKPSAPYALLLTRDQLAGIVEEAVRKALHPDGLPDETRFLQVEATDQDGQKWRGVLYGVKEMEDTKTV